VVEFHPYLLWEQKSPPDPLAVTGEGVGTEEEKET